MKVLNPNYAVTIVQSETNTSIVAPLPETFTFDVVSEYSAPFSQGILGSSSIASLARVAGAKLTTQVMTAQLWQGATEFELTLELEFMAESDVLKEVRDPILALMKLGAASDENGFLTAPGPRLNLEMAGQIAADTLKGGVQVAKYALDTGLNAIGSDVKTLQEKIGVGAVDGAKTLIGQEETRNGSNQSSIPKNNINSIEPWKNKIKNQISIMIGNYAFFDSVVITDVNKVYEGQLDAYTGWPLHAKVMVRFKPLFLVLKDDLERIFKVRSQEQLNSTFASRLAVNT